MTDSSCTGGEALVATLATNGVTDMFALPGIQLDWAVDALARQSDIAVYVPRHEQSVSYMADGYARISGTPGVGMVVPGPGVLNACAGLSTAYACNTPLLFIAGQIHSGAIDKGFGHLHEIPDQSGILSRLTKANTLVRERATLGPSVAQALTDTMSGRCRPVSVEIPHDLLVATGPGGAVRAQSPQPAASADKVAVERVAKLLDQAAFPVLFIGGGCKDAGAQIKVLAEKLSIPVIASDNARGVLADSHPLAFSALAGRPLITEADLVVVIGSRFMDMMAPEPSWPQHGKTFIYVNIDPADITEPRVPEVYIEADAAVATQALADATAKREVITAAQAARVKEWAQRQILATGLLWEYVDTLARALPDDGIFVNELTQVGYLARVALPVHTSRSYIGPGYQGTLGYSFPTALGAAVAGGGRRVLAITGDGGFGWSYQELSTAARYSLPVTLVVFSDGHYGNVRAIQNRTFGREFITELHNPNFAELAHAFGIDYALAKNPTELAQTLISTMNSDGPVVIEVPVEEMASPWPLLRLQPMQGTPKPSDYAGLL